MTWGEAVRHTITLSADPSSHVGAAVNGLQFPASREYLALYRLNANYVARYTQKRAKFGGLPDPFEVAPKRFGTPLTRDDYHAVVAAHRSHPAEQEASTVI